MGNQRAGIQIKPMNTTYRIMRTIIIIFALFSCGYLNAQWVWVGGTPGRPSDWMEPRNWNLNRVPDEGSSVRIPQLNQPFYPEIKESVPSIAHLEVAGGAELHVLTNGLLQIDGQDTYDAGILLIGKIYIHGLIAVFNTAQSEITGNEGNLITYTDGGQLSFSPSY
jgi:hypothetical protein